MRAHRLCSLLLTFLAVLCMTAVPSAVSAAGSEEPENDYYREHWEEFAREDRVYLLTEDQELFDAPDGEPLTELKEGDSVRISYAQPEDGESGWLSGIIQEQERWGLTEVARGGTWYTGWLIMDSMELPYDGKEFFAEYESEIQPYAVELDPETAREASVWEYPYSGQYKGRISEVTLNAKISYLYTGEDGLNWGYTDYGGGIRGWICLDHPQGDGLPVADMQRGADSQTDGLPGSFGILFLCLAGIAGFCAVLWILLRKKKTAGGE